MTHFSITIFFHGHIRLTGQDWKGEDHFLLHSTTSTCSQTFRHLFATMHVRWLSHTLNRNPCIYQTATRWEFTTLSNYHLIDWWCEVYFSLFTWWFDTRFLLQQSWYGKPVQSNSKLPSILGINSRFYQNQDEYHEERLQWDALVWFEPESTIFHQFCDFWGMDMYSMEMWFSPHVSSGVKMKITATKNSFKESQLTKKIDQL